MLRKLVDYKKLSHEVAARLIEMYPYGYGDEDIIMFKNIHGEIIEAVEVKTEDTIYLVKISKSLASFISNFEDNMEKELDDQPESETFDSPSDEMELELNHEEEESKMD
ncbi:hypothetical protein KO529_12775 [Arenibacter algicola]|uniref:hypothetical protein n=1 Tax=Arenibacter algicola TaxID=616991 RepID=UPI001C06DF7F|nr:hypothetical protein [Arenibacter algicola]MBU2905666.1 hypothetical protein [Arenibacter algicola]